MSQQQETNNAESPLPRLLGDWGSAARGPTLVLVAGAHGNEGAGIAAVHRLHNSLTQLGCTLQGRLLALAGNLEALKQRVRYIDSDLNRIWRPEALCEEGSSEWLERKQLTEQFLELEEQSQEPLTVIDLHTFSSKGTPFLIISKCDPLSTLTRNLPFPVIKNLNTYVLGTLCGYLAERGHFALAFEGGCETDSEAPVHIEAFLWQILDRMGMIGSDRLSGATTDIWNGLFQTRQELPTEMRAAYRHRIGDHDNFRMKPGFKTFDKVEKNAELANDRHGPVLAPFTGWLLMPLYQGQGEDGFFMATAQRDE